MIIFSCSMREEIKPHWSVKLDDLRIIEEVKEEKRDDSFRPISLKCGVFEESRGSAYVEIGQTKVLVEIDGPRESPSAGSQRGRLIVKIDSDSLRIRAQLESALSSIVHLEKYPRSEFIINISLLSSSGGELSASIMASSLALVHSHVEMLDIPVAAHVVKPHDSSSFIIDPSSPISPSSVSITVSLMPNLNQLICTDIRGALTLTDTREAIAFASKQALRLYPLMRKSIVAAFSKPMSTVSS